MSTAKPTGLRAPSRISRPAAAGVTKTPPSVGAAKPTQADKSSAEAQDAGEQFKLGDRVWVNGNKPGVVQFLGETQFAPGQWAGIVLDEPIGKNDGSVSGVRYFQCDALQGIFTRPSKLSRTEGEADDTMTSPPSRAASPTPSATPASASTKKPAKTTTAASELARSKSESVSNLSECGSVKKGDRELKINDRVLVAGSKAGAVRFLGETEFAKGEWCGVELDEPLGKNDGAVAGTRYFQCQHKYGLFAPVHKVTRIGFPSTTTAKAKSTVRKAATTASELKRSPSASSISSMSSVASSTSCNPSRTGLLTETSARYARKVSGTTALQEALKEKQQHIEQLLTERDLERAEVAKANSHVGEVEQELSILRDGQEQYVLEADAKLDQLRVLVEAADREKVELLNQLEEEKRKVEDLQFRMEEACITKGDLETQTQLEHALLKELEQSLLFEKTKADKLQRELEDSRVATVSEKSRILELERDLALRDTEVAALRKSLEAVSGQDGVPEEELSSLHKQLAKNNEQLSGQPAKSKEENSNIVEEWRAKLASVEASHHQALEELRASHEAGTSELEEVRNALEQLELTHKLELKELANKRASEAMSWTGDTKEHKAQLLKVSEESERLVETLRTSLEKKEEQHLVEMEEVLGKLHSAELRVKELEDAGVKLGQQLREKAEEALEQETVLQTLQSQNSQENRDMQRLLIQIEEAKSQARSQEEKVTELISVLEVKQQELSGLLQEKSSLEQEVSVLKQNLEKTSHDQATSAQTDQGLQRNLKASEERILLLTKDKTKLENDIVDMTKSTGDSSTLITKLNEEIKQKERRLEELQKQLEEEREKAAHAEEERSRAKSLEQKHRAELSSLQETITLLEKSAADNQAKAKDVLAAGEKALADAVERHSKEMQELHSQFDSLKKECDGLNDQLKEMKMRESTFTSESEKENAALQQSLRTQSALISEKDTELDSLRNELDALKQQNSQYEENLSSDHQKISEEIEELKQAVAEKAQAVEALKHEKEKLTVELASSHKDGNVLLNLKKECDRLNDQLKEMKLRESTFTSESEKENTALQQSLRTQSALISEKDTELDSLRNEFKKECDSLNSQLKKIKVRESTFTSESEKENAALQQSLRTQSALISEKDTELDSLRNEIAGLQSSLKLYRSENTQLQERVKGLESLADAQISGTDDSALKTWKEAKENAEGQVEFLNSVIVDLRRKNEDLTSKLETMSEAALNGNGAAETDAHSSHAEPTLKKQAPPRLFCDICDCFDLHDTEDCPTQDQMLDSLPHTSYHGSTSDQRPYCDICEVFGHWTESCKDDQTF